MSCLLTLATAALYSAPMCASSGKCGESERAAPSTTQPKTALLARLVDAHCHPTDSAAYAGPPTSIEEVHLLKIVRAQSALRELPSLAFLSQLAMSTRLDDQQATVDLHEAFPAKVIPCFGKSPPQKVPATADPVPGLHPWFAHQISLAPASSLPSKEYHYATLFPVCPEHPDELHPALEALLPSLPSPVSILDFLNQLERHLIAYPSALLGEVGIDRAFRIPNQPGSVEAKQNALSPLATPLPHQLAVVVAQIEVAIRLRRSISFHSVRSAQETVALLARLKKKDGFERIHLCLHSFGGKPESINQIQKGARSLSFPRTSH